MYNGEEHVFEFEYRDPQKWIERLVADPTLASASCFHSATKYYCEGDFTERIWDEPYTGDAWRKVDVSIFIRGCHFRIAKQLYRMNYLNPIRTHTATYHCTFGWTKV